MHTNGEATSTGQVTTGIAERATSSAKGGNGKTGVIVGIQEQVSSRVDAQKNRAADGLGNIADVFHQAGDQLRAQNESLASLVDGASDQLRRFAVHLRDRGAGDLMSEVTEFGRRRPALFIGGALLIGLGVARFLKSSAERSDGQTGPFADARFRRDPMTGGAETAVSYGVGGFGQPTGRS